MTPKEIKDKYGLTGREVLQIGRERGFIKSRDFFTQIPEEKYLMDRMMDQDPRWIPMGFTDSGPCSNYGHYLMRLETIEEWLDRIDKRAKDIIKKRKNNKYLIKYGN